MALPEELFIKYALRPSTIWKASTDLQSKCFVYREKVCIGQHRTIASSRFGGSFLPILRLEKFEIPTVFLFFSNLALTKNLLSNLLAELCGIALENTFKNGFWKGVNQRERID